MLEPIRQGEATWLLGDGTLQASSIELQIKRVAHAGPTHRDRSRYEHTDQWLVCVTHEDGRGRPVQTHFVFEHRFDVTSRTGPVSITNRFGAQIFDPKSVNLESPLGSIALAGEGAAPVLGRLCCALYHALRRLCGWTMTDGSPILATEGRGAAIVTEWHDKTLQLMAPEEIGFAHAGQLLCDALEGSGGGLALRMADHVQCNPQQGQLRALLTRFAALDAAEGAAGLDYQSCVRALVNAGLPLSPFPNADFNVVTDQAGGVAELTSRSFLGTTSVLFWAVMLHTPQAVRTLIALGADPLQEITTMADGAPSVTSPFITAVSNNQTDLVRAMVADASDARLVQALSVFDNRFADSPSFWPGASDDVRALMASIRARLQLQDLTAALPTTLH